LLPKYGSSPKAELQEAADAKFISAIDEQYHGDRNKACTELVARGWQYLAERNLADAMRRFNEAWLLKKWHRHCTLGYGGNPGQLGKIR
jgi:hypothetical protein